MFEETIRALQNLSDEKSTVAISADDDNYFDRECPAPECLAQFKVLMADWRIKLGTRRSFVRSAAIPLMLGVGGPRNSLIMHGTLL